MGRGSKNSDPHPLNDDRQQETSILTTSNSAMINNDHGKGQYTWDEIRCHSKKNDRWIVIDKRVYDVTRWTKHPGGQVVLNHYAGQDSTVRIVNKFYK
jgi:cytochrome b involved in lipid metabolism